MAYRNLDKERVLAREMYVVQKKGVAETARALGISRDAVQTWKKAERWDDLRATAEPKIVQAVVEAGIAREVDRRTNLLEFTELVMRDAKVYALDPATRVLEPTKYEDTVWGALAAARLQREILDGGVAGEAVRVEIHLGDRVVTWPQVPPGMPPPQPSASSARLGFRTRRNDGSSTRPPGS